MFILISILLNSISYAGNHTGETNINIKDYKNKRTWHKIPNILVCNNSPMSKKSVESAINIWKKQGSVVGKVFHESELPHIKCTQGNYDKIGYIQIKGYDGSFDQKIYDGWTWTSKNKSENVCGATIVFASYVKDNKYNFKTLLHEIGHGIGYPHQNIKNDLMNETF